MDRTDRNPSANVPKDGATKGDLGEKGKTWNPPPGEQGISNRPGDDDAIPEFDEVDVNPTKH